MVIFLDTSAIYALADRDEPRHAEAKRLFDRARKSGARFLLHNYVLAESAALLSRRLGRAHARKFLAEAEGFEVRWVDEQLHREAILRWKDRPAKVSFVDQVSFLVMREYGTGLVLAFDVDFQREGFISYRGTEDDDKQGT